jgi:peroxiredoxin
MRLLFLIVPTCLFAQVDLTGSWINENSQTGGVTQVTVRRDGVRTLAHVWGSCHPIDCDWGETETELWNGIPMAIWKHGFSTTRMQFIPQPDGRMLVAYRSEYHDESGRKDPGHAEFFARKETLAETPETIAARMLLRTVAETYRNLPAAYFEMVETVHRKTGKSEIRTITRNIWYFSPPDKMRSESTGERGAEVWIRDGRTTWAVYPDANEFSQTPQGKGAASGTIAGIYGVLDQGRGVPRIAGRERVAEADCTVVEIAMERDTRQKFWIDDATHLVRQDSLDSGSLQHELVYSVARLGEKFDPQLFVYDPAATHAQNRRQLAREAPATLVGKPAPDFTLRDLDGNEVRLSALRGKAVLLDFWGAWCGYCREALPGIEMIHRGLRDKGLLVFGIHSEAPEIAREYLQKYGYTLPSLVDRKEEAVQLYHLQGWPTTVLIDREGKVVYYGSGDEPQKLRDAIRAVGVW